MRGRLPMLHRPSWLRLPHHLAGRVALVNSVQVLLLGGSLSWFTYSLGHHNGLLVSEQIRQAAVVQELAQNLSQRLGAPRTINALNLVEIQSGHHPLHDYDHYARLFWQQMRVFPVAYINIGTSSGDFVGVERSDDGQLLLNEDTPLHGRGRIAVSSLGPTGDRGRLLELIPGMTTFHEEAWYADTVRAGRATWSSIYSWEDKPEIFSISYNTPLYGAGGQLRGVIGVDMVLSQLSTWLAGIWKPRNGLALIVEPDGRLVASSRPGDTLVRVNGALQRAPLQSLRDPLAQALLRESFEHRAGGLRPKPGVLEAVQLRRVAIGGRDLYLDASPWGREEGLNWVLLTAVPAQESTAVTQRSARLALLLSSLALLLAVLLTNRAIRSLLQPLNRLQQAASNLARGLDDPQAEALTFHSGITAADGAEMEALEGAIGRLVDQFNSQNAELRRSTERERLRDAQALTLLQRKLRSSLEAAAVAHEINQPLSVVLWNSQLLLEQLRRQPETGLPAGWREQITSISQEAERVVATIETMRTLLRNVQTEAQPLDLREVTNSALLYLRSGELNSSVTLEEQGLGTGQDPAWIAGDAVQIQIAIVNLLRNAIQVLRDAATPTPWIGLSLVRDEAGWTLSVADNGPGFPPEVDPEAPLESARAGGSGLGLFVVRTTMDNHNGQMRIGRSSRGGAQVSLRFPHANPTSSNPPRTGD
ncbi:MAG: ATP-binding protein [Vulcanococcus sp.]